MDPLVDPTGDAPFDAPFDPGTLVELFAEAAEALHRPGPLEPKFRFVVDAARAATGASAVTYARLTSRWAVRMVAGQTVEEAERMLGSLDGSLRALEQSAAPQPVDTVSGDGRHTTLLIPVTGRARRPHGALVLLLPEAVPIEAAGWVTEGLALHLGTALDNTATITHLAELEASRQEVVRRLHDAVRPEAPAIEGAELGVHYQPADPDAPIGGDLYDWHVLPDGDLHLAVIDVTGKGVAATKDALSVTHALRLLALDDCPMDQLVTRADEVLGESQPELVATVAVARYRPSTGDVRVVAAGHPPPLLVTPDGKVEFLEVRGVPIGWPGARSLGHAERRLERNQALVLYTDGVIEARRDVIGGLETLRDAAEDVGAYPAPYLARGISDRALAGAVRNDDSVVLVVRHRGLDAPAAPALGPFRYRFSPLLAMLPLVRHSFDDWLGYQPIDATYRTDLLFAASELCTNAMRASTGAPRSVELRAGIEGDSVWIEVEDDGPGFLPSDRADPPDPETEAGRGIFLVRALTDDIEVERRDGHTVTRCFKRAAVVPAPSGS